MESNPKSAPPENQVTPIQQNAKEQKRADWLVDFEGRIAGPFTLPQINEFVRKGDFSEKTPLTTEHLQGKWIPAQEALTQYLAKDPVNLKDKEPVSSKQAAANRPPQAPQMNKEMNKKKNAEKPADSTGKTRTRGSLFKPRSL